MTLSGKNPKTNTETAAENDLTELVFILDRSGSMAPLTEDTIGGYNSLLDKQRGEEGGAIVTTVLFDDAYDVIVEGADIETVNPLDNKTYYARGMTALLDAVGKTLISVETRQNRMPADHRPGKTVVAIITDGCENASREFSLETVKRMIEARKKNGWEFLFLGANIDAVKTAGSFGIDASRAATYRADAVGTRLNFMSVGNFMAKARACEAVDETWKEDIERYERS